MVLLPGPISELIGALSQLPGIGPRSAERIALYLIQAESSLSEQLAQTALAARRKVQLCQICGGLTEAQPCPVCSSDVRDATLICLVERPVDIFSIEKSGVFKGKYHVLGGKISPVNGVGPEDLRIQALEERFQREPIQEIILALSSDVEGDATSYFLAQKFGSRIKLSRLAHGLPVGAGLDFADELTLSRAIEGRRPMA